MIANKKELSLYIQADRIMNGYPRKKGVAEIIQNWINIIFGAGVTGGGKLMIINYLELMRKYSFYLQQKGLLNKIKRFRYGSKFKKFGLKLGFSIGADVFGYGLVIPHYGTIVVGEPNHIGNYAVLHTSTCISAKDSEIGDGLYLSTGVKITQQVKLGKGIMIGANSVVNKSFDDNQLIVGVPAKSIGLRPIWYENESIFYERVKKIEQLKQI